MMSNNRTLPARGVVYTPQRIADEVTSKALGNFDRVPRRILEPGVGEGAFLNSLVGHEVPVSNITAVDLDEVVIARVRDRYETAKTIHSDFVDYALKQQQRSFDLVIGNPPYLKNTEFNIVFREQISKVSTSTGFPNGDLKNAWAVFTVLSAALLDIQGVLAFVVPHQLLTAKYGRAVQSHLLKVGFELDVFVADFKAFTSIEQDAVVLIARRSKTRSKPLCIKRVQEFSNLTVKNTAEVASTSNGAAAIDVKSVLLKPSTVDLLRQLRDEWAQISDYCTSSTGTVTAANEVFVVREDLLERLDLQPWARKIVRKGSHMPPGLTFSLKDKDRFSRSAPCNLIDFCSEGAPPLTESARRYIAECEARSIHLRYKSRNRTPWYNIPYVPAGDGLFFKRANLFHKLYINQASILATDSAYHVRMLNGLAIEDLCFSFYNSITLLFAEIDGRSYFGGVLELTPREFRGLPVHFIKPKLEEFSKFKSTLESSNQSVARICELSDQRLCEELGISSSDMLKIREALEILRLYRRRHSNGESYEQWIKNSP